jgi:nucleoside-diphosphate-sugar epimerase
MKTVLVTGAAGFIGGHTLQRLATRGYKVEAVSRVARPSSDAVRWRKADILDIDAVEKLIYEVRPTHLLHLAWITEHGIYWSAPENVAWLIASLKLLELFGRAGGERAVGLGTCAEYDWSAPPPYREATTPLLPRNLYGAAKNSLSLMQPQIARHFHFKQAWCRPFFLYGPGENPSRFVPSLACSLLRGESPVCRDPKAIRDFLHVDDIAEAIATVLDSDFEGAVNLSSGQGAELGEVANMLSMLAGSTTAISCARNVHDGASLVGDASVLTSLGFLPQFGLRSGLAETLEWWRDHLRAAPEGV